MKKATLLCGILLALTATAAFAAPGTEIRWNNCFGDGGATNVSFACNVNTGTNTMVCSYVLATDVLATSGQEVVVDIAAAGSTLPAWWQVKNVGSCRLSGLNINAVTTSPNCTDWASGGATSGFAYVLGERGPNCARIKFVSAVDAAALADQFAGTEYFSCNILLNNTKTVGTGACAGCNIGVCIVFNSIKITTQVAANDRTVFGATNGTDSNFVTWQTGGAGCPAATPTRSATWGAVKSLYR